MPEEHRCVNYHDHFFFFIIVTITERTKTVATTAALGLRGAAASRGDTLNSYLFGYCKLLSVRIPLTAFGVLLALCSHY